LSGASIRKLCAVFAHPDDEAFGIAGTTARYAEDGVEITLITATSGEAGEVRPGVSVDRKDLGAVRERELREAANAMGITHLRLLHLPDGHLSEIRDRLYAAIRDALAEIRPQVVIAEDIQGITGHPDHIAVTNATRAAFDELTDSGLLKLYEHVEPSSVVGNRPNFYGTPEDHITSWIDVGRWQQQARAALAAHRTQVDEATLERVAGGLGPYVEHYVCVRSRVPIVIPEDDLFAGVPA
jgi:LmbE family N-acetylglucosaminyl deacetylase